MKLKVMNQKLSVCKVEELPADVLNTELCLVGKTDEELSLVCETGMTP